MKEQAIQKLLDARREVINTTRLKLRRNDVDDVVSEGYYRVFKNLDKMDLTGNVVGYLHTTIGNCAINQYRKEQVSKGFPVHLDVADFSEKLVSYNRPKGLSQELLYCINKLSKRDAQVITLMYVMDYSEEETAKIMNIPQGTVKSICYRALRKIKKDLQENFNITKMTELL